MFTKRIAALFLVCLLLIAPRASADLDADQFSSEEWLVALKGPKGWQLSEQTSYPSILLWMVHRLPDARMLFTAEPLASGTTAQHYATVAAKKLEQIGFQVRAPQLHSATGAYWMDLDDGKNYLRQALLVANDTGYSLTLSTTDLRTRGQLLRAFDYSLRSIRPTRLPAKDPTNESSSEQPASAP